MYELMLICCINTKFPSLKESRVKKNGTKTKNSSLQSVTFHSFHSFYFIFGEYFYLTQLETKRSPSLRKAQRFARRSNPGKNKQF